MNAFFYPSKRGINFAKIRGFKVTDYIGRRCPIGDKAAVWPGLRCWVLDMTVAWPFARRTCLRYASVRLCLSLICEIVSFLQLFFAFLRINLQIDSDENLRFQ